MIRLGVAGALGRMGSTIIRLVIEDKRFKLAGVFEKGRHPDSGKSIDALLGLAANTGLALAEENLANLKKIDVLIDFTLPEATCHVLRIAQDAKCGMVIGTTGLSEAQRSEIKEASKQIPIVFSPNMSLGANLIFELARVAAKRLGDGYDIEITEAHHRMKKDAPSGTAKKLEEEIALAKNKKPGQIPIHSIRAGEIVGDHTAIFSGAGETIEITHRAQSRNAFAQGALSAARFAASKKNGLFSMQDVLSASSKAHGRKSR